MRDARTIKETREAVTAIVTAFDAWHKASEDGKVSFLEWASFARMIPEFWEALRNAGSIPRELADLDGLEADELIEMIASILNTQVKGHDLRLKIDKTLIAFHAIADAAAQWRGVNPPRAEIVP